MPDDVSDFASGRVGARRRDNDAETPPALRSATESQTVTPATPLSILEVDSGWVALRRRSRKMAELQGSKLEGLSEITATPTSQLKFITDAWAQARACRPGTLCFA